MHIKTNVRAGFEQAAREQDKVLGGLTGDRVLLESGLESRA